MTTRTTLLMSAGLFLFACSPTESQDGLEDAGPRADGGETFDASFDAAPAMLDGGWDTGFDAGPSPVSVEVVVRGNGSVAIELQGEITDCTESCTLDAFVGDALSLSPTPAGLAEPGVWGGLCDGSVPGEACELTLEESGTVTVDFRPGLVTLDVSVQGFGEVQIDQGGVVTSCVDTCSVSGIEGEQLSFVAVPHGRSRPTIWSGLCDGSESNICALTLVEPGVVGAEFPPGLVDIQIDVSGVGRVDIVHEGTMSTCEGSCTVHGVERESLQLVATPLGRSRAPEFMGLCAGAAGGNCTLTLSDHGTIQVDFPPGLVDITLTLSGEGRAGVLLDGVAQPNCQGPGTCTIHGVERQSLQVRAISGGRALAGVWGGLCAGNGFATCTRELADHGTISIDFPPAPVDIDLAITGVGRVGVMLDGVRQTTCIGPGTCTISGVQRQSLQLRAIPDGRSRAGVWGDLCTGNSLATCTLTLDDHGDVSVDFPPGLVDIDLSITGYGRVDIDLDGATQSCVGPGSCTIHGLERQSLSLDATPTGRSRAGVWGDLCAGTSGSTCTFTTSDHGNISIDFPPGLVDIDLTITGYGQVAVDLDGATQTCVGPGSCTIHGVERQSLSLSATPTGRSRAGIWGGLCAGTAGGTCAFTTSDHGSVAIDFPPGLVDITLVVPGGGRVRANHEGTYTDCRGTCTIHGVERESLVLTAFPDAGHYRDGWTGLCAGRGTAATCSVTLSDHATIQSNFAIYRYDIETTYSFESGASGSVNYSAGGTLCSGGDVCRTYDWDTTVTLSASAGANSAFMGWSGACAGQTGNTCTLANVRSAQSVGARFERLRVVQIGTSGDGSGTVAFGTSGVACIPASSSCRRFVPGTTVTVNASPAISSEVVTWAGASCAGNSCTFPASDTTITPEIDLRRFEVTVVNTSAGYVVPSSSATREDCATPSAGCFRYPYGSRVQITPGSEPSATAGSYQDRFDRWTSAGCDSTSAGVCTIDSLTSDLTLTTAWISHPRLTVTVRSLGHIGSTYLYSGFSPSPICRNTTDAAGEVSCTYYPDRGSSFSVRAYPAADYYFESSVSSSCFIAGSPPTCTGTISTPRTVIARFSTLI